VTVIDPRTNLLGFADREISDALMYFMRQYGARFILGETVEKIEPLPDRAIVHLSTGKLSWYTCLEIIENGFP